jgi:outer membrane protein TolC
MIRYIFVQGASVVFLVLVVISSLAAQQRAVVLDALTLEGAVQLALEHHSSLKAAEASIRSSEASLTQSRANYFPTLTASATGTRTEGAFVFNPDFPPREQAYNNYSTGLQIQQTIYDFGKTSQRVSANFQFVEASTLDYQSTRSAVIANVQLAYFSLVQAQRLIQVNEETVAQAAEHLTQAKAFYAVGRRPQFDVTRSEVDLANANVNLIRARNQVRLAKVQLENAMGVHPTTRYSIADSFTITPFTMSLDSAKAIAFERRQELRAARARLEANQSLVSATWSQHLPTLSANGTYTWSGFNFPLYSRWNAGITLSLPLFQGFSVVAQVQQAQANADVVRANIDVLTETILLEVEQNFLGLKEAEERIGATTKLVEQAGENLKIAEGRYNSGVGSAIEITDAQVALSNARITNIQTLFDYNSSLVRLRRAMGTPGQ